jgi:hypothetical protein
MVMRSEDRGGCVAGEAATGCTAPVPGSYMGCWGELGSTAESRTEMAVEAGSRRNQRRRRKSTEEATILPAAWRSWDVGSCDILSCFWAVVVVAVVVVLVDELFLRGGFGCC